MRRPALAALTGVAAYTELRGRAAVTLSGKHDSLWEGATLGLVVATSTWLWLAVVDALARQPFHAVTALGGIALFTAMHYLLNLVYSMVIVSAVRAAAREPSLVIAVVFGCLIVLIAFAMGTALLSHVGLGEFAWVEIFGGHVIGSVIAIIILSRRHPLLARLREAEAET
jgi:hypothetical protein